MKSVSITQLVSEGYICDMIAKRRFERRWIVPCLVPAIGFLAVIALGLLEFINLHTTIIVACILLLISGTGLIAKHNSNPRSRHTRYPLRKAKNENPDWPILEEIVYICDASKTYFTSPVTEDPENIQSEQAASSNH